MVRIVEPERDNRPKRRRKRRHIVEPGREQSTFVLSLSRRGIREFPQDILRLVNLRRLKLNGNLLTGLSYNINQLSNLRYLNLTANSFKIFPEIVSFNSFSIVKYKYQYFIVLLYIQCLLLIITLLFFILIYIIINNFLVMLYAKIRNFR